MRAMGGKMKAMDALKAALAERQAKAQKVKSETGQTWIRQADVEKQRVDKYLEDKRQEEERQKELEEAHFAKLEEHLSQRKEDETEAGEKAIPQHILDAALLADDDAEPPVAQAEVIERLREMAQPATLFGETDMVRYRRLRQVTVEMHEGKKNPDLVMLENVHMGQHMQALHNDKDEEEAEADNDASEDEASDDKGEEAANDDKSDSEDEGENRVVQQDKSDSEDEGDAIADAARAQMMQAAAAHQRQANAAAEGAPEADAGAPADAAAEAKAAAEAEPVPEVDLTLMDRCDFVRAWARKALKAWEKELADRPDEVKKTAINKTEIAAHRQVRRDVRPLQKRLRLYRMEDWLLQKIHVIVKFASEREYRNASEAYLDLSIGKAAWPVGLGCGGSMLMEDAIGLHDRFNRNGQVKDIAFALNDDVTRKFVQALKRLMNQAQKYWPPEDPSKAC